jgi:hypothetical protein
MERKTKGTGRRGRKYKQLQYDLKEKRGFCKLKEEETNLISGEMALEETVDLSESGLHNG